MNLQINCKNRLTRYRQSEICTDLTREIHEHYLTFIRGPLVPGVDEVVTIKGSWIGRFIIDRVPSTSYLL